MVSDLQTWQSFFLAKYTIGGTIALITLYCTISDQNEAPSLFPGDPLTRTPISIQPLVGRSGETSELGNYYYCLFFKVSGVSQERLDLRTTGVFCPGGSPYKIHVSHADKGLVLYYAAWTPVYHD